MSKLSHLWFSRPDKYGKINYKLRRINYINWCVLLLSMENQTNSRCCWSIQMNTDEHLPSSMCPFSSRNGAQEFSEAEIAIHLDLEDITVPFHWDSRRILYAIGITRWPMPNAKRSGGLALGESLRLQGGGTTLPYINCYTPLKF